MRKVTRVITALTFAAIAFSVTTPAMAETKIVSVRTGEVIQKSPQYKAGAEKMKAEFERRKNDFDAEFKKFVEDAEKFKKERDLISAADLAKREKDLSARQVDLQYKKRQLEEDMVNRDRQLTAEMGAKIQATIVQVAKERGAELVVAEPVYAAETVDITADVLKRLQAGGGVK